MRWMRSTVGAQYRLLHYLVKFLRAPCNHTSAITRRLSYFLSLFRMCMCMCVCEGFIVLRRTNERWNENSFGGILFSGLMNLRRGCKFFIFYFLFFFFVYWFYRQLRFGNDKNLIIFLWFLCSVAIKSYSSFILLKFFVLVSKDTNAVLKFHMSASDQNMLLLEGSFARIWVSDK